MNDEYLKMTREVHPVCKLPDDLDTTVWRYMDFRKFESLLRESALYLCRADRLQDQFEGTYSRQQLVDMEAWIDHPEIVELERRDRIQDRNRTYISCWCVSELDLDLMWKAYVRNPPGVAVKSTVRRLQQACDSDKAVYLWSSLDISLVRYVDHAGGEIINYPGMPEVFFCKDLHFRLDNELRIVHWSNMMSPTPDHVFLPVSLSDLLVSVVLAPGASTEIVNKARKNLNQAGLKEIAIVFSRDDRQRID